MGEYAAAGLFEQPERSLFYRKAVGLRRYYETCALPAYTGGRLYPCGVAEMPEYMENLPIDLNRIQREEPAIGTRIREEFYRYSSSVPKEHTVAGDMFTHSMPNYERVLKEGFASYRDRAAKCADPDFRDGLLCLIDGIETYLNRSVAYLESVQADPALVRALKKVPMYPAENIYEAIVSWNVVLYLDHCDNLGCVAAGLKPYHAGEDVTDLLAELFDNLDANGGPRYQWSVINYAGLINVIDSLLVVRDLVFRERRYTAAELLQMLRDDDPRFLQEAKRHPVCFGRNDPDADAFGAALSTAIFSMTDGKKPHFGTGFLPSSIQFISQVSAGKQVGASPDGRAAGTPLCDSLGAIFGKDIHGPTALLNSVTALNLERALGTPILNFNINPDFRDEILKSLILAYQKKGGIQM